MTTFLFIAYKVKNFMLYYSVERYIFENSEEIIRCNNSLSLLSVDFIESSLPINIEH